MTKTKKTTLLFWKPSPVYRKGKYKRAVHHVLENISNSAVNHSKFQSAEHTRPYALKTGETVSVPASSRTNRFGNFCTIKYQFTIAKCDMS